MVKIDEVLPAEILSSIFCRLSYIDLVRSRAVSSYWNSQIVKGHQIPPSPLLMLPSIQVDCNDSAYRNSGFLKLGEKHVSYLGLLPKEFRERYCLESSHGWLGLHSGFLKLGETQVSYLRRIPEEFRESCCVGSSHGWLGFLEDQAVPSLYHPFKQIKIQLPSLLHLLRLNRLERKPDGTYKVEYSCGFTYNVKRLQLYFILKFILTGQPDHNYQNFGVIILYWDNDRQRKIAYYESGGKLRTWVSLASDVDFYHDIIWQHNRLYALTIDGIGLKTWLLRDGFLTKSTNIILSDPLSYCIDWRRYLIESFGDILLVVEKRLNYEPDVSTCLFQVYRLDTNKHKWVKMNSLDDRVLFLDGSHAVSLSIQSFPDCEKNSIYFINDYSGWAMMRELNADGYKIDHIGGDDMGIYNLTNGSVKPIFEFSPHKIRQAPHWIIPTSNL